MKSAYTSGGHVGLDRFMLALTPPSQDSAMAIRLAVLFSSVGDLDTAFAHLDRALDSRDPALVHLAVAPQWDSLRDDPRFHERLIRVGLGR